MASKKKPPAAPDFDPDEIMERADYPTPFQCYDLDAFDNPECRPWVNMAAAVDRHGDVKPLLDLLRSLAPPQVSPILDDLLKRYELRLVKKPHGQSQPVYALTSEQTNRLDAYQEAKERLDAPGLTEAERDDIIRDAAKWYRISTETLKNALLGKDGTVNRALSRLERLRRPI